MHAQPGEVECGVSIAQGPQVIKEPEPAGCETAPPQVPWSPSFGIVCEHAAQEEHDIVLC